MNLREPAVSEVSENQNVRVDARSSMPRYSRVSTKNIRAQAMARRASGGWSLMELTVVLVIIGLLASLVGPRVLTYLERGQVDAANIQMKHIKSGLLTYKMDIGELPTTDQGLEALVKAPSGEAAQYWRGPYLDEQVPLDPWRTPYRYERRADNDRGYVLYSLGADKEPGGDGNDADFGLLPERS